MIDHFLKLLNRGGAERVSSIAPEAFSLLEAYPWPGNVRELQSAIKYAYVQSAGEIITPDCLPTQLRNGAPRARRGASEADAGQMDVADLVANLLRQGETDIYEKVNAAVDRVVVETVLRHVKGNQVQASELLGISRTTLRSKFCALGLAVEKQLLPESGQND